MNNTNGLEEKFHGNLNDAGWATAINMPEGSWPGIEVADGIAQGRAVKGIERLKAKLGPISFAQLERFVQPEIPVIGSWSRGMIPSHVSKGSRSCRSKISIGQIIRLGSGMHMYGPGCVTWSVVGEFTADMGC